MSTLVVACGNYSATPEHNTHLFDEALALDVSVGPTKTARAVAIDADLNIYVIGWTSSSMTFIKKFNSAGTEITSGWDKWFDGSYGGGIAVDDDGYVYTATNPLRKYASDGTEVTTGNFPISQGSILKAITVDAAGNIYVTGERASSITTSKYDSSGSVLWTADHFSTCNGIAVDADGNVYTVGVRVSSVTLRKYNSSGTQQWTKDHGGTLNGVAVDSSGNVYVVGERVSSVTMRKYSSSGTEDTGWRKDHGAEVFAVAVAPSGDVYTGGTRTSNVAIRRYSAAGTALETADRFTIRGIALRVGALVTTVPALALPIALGAVFATGFHEVPALAFPLSLGVPSSTERTPLERPLLAIRTIYRLILTGLTSEMITYPLRGIQCQRRVNASTWMTADIGVSDAGMEAVVAAHVGLDMLIEAGYGFSDGSEQVGAFLRAVVTGYEVAETPHGLALSVTGRVINPPFTAATRTLTSISRIRTDSERRTVTCAVDPLLRPNDTAVAGAESFTVGAIDYRIDPWQATMTVTEALDG